MAYRNDVDALEARLASVEAELADKTRARDETARMVEEARARAANDQLAADWAAGGPQLRRRTRTRIAIAVTTFLALVAGGVTYKLTRHRADPFEGVIQRFALFTEQMCGCHDTKCANAVSDEMTRWATELAKDMQDPKKPDEVTMKRVEKLAERMGKCMTEAMSTRPEPEAVDQQQGLIHKDEALQQHRPLSTVR